MKKKFYRFDYILLFCVILLTIVGIVMVYSASSYSATINYGDKYHFLKKQIVGSIIGIACLVFCMLINIE